MNSIQSFAALISGSGLLISVLAIPLVLRRVPPNSFYGIRTKASFASDSDWYRINVIGGRYLALSGLVILVIGIVGFFLPVSFRDPYSISATVAALLAVIIPCIRLGLLKPCTSPNDKGRNA
jgi:uncharacterized membrane protein